MALVFCYPVLLLVVGTVIALVFYDYIKKKVRKRITDFPRIYQADAVKGTAKDFFDVAIVGAGPSGSTCGYFLGKANRSVVLLEKKKFPRDKYCGDAVCKTAIEILDEMGIYKKLLAENKAKIADNGGMVSPSGLSYIGRSKDLLGDIPAAIACKRIHLDEAIAMAAKSAGADLRENCPVSEAIFNTEEGLWTVKIEGSDDVIKARLLVCADGATSKLAGQLGIVTGPPTSNCSRSYVKGGTHKFKADGVIFWNREMLPGYSALFKHPNDELNYCVYIIPGNPKVTTDDLPKWHEKLKTEDPFISKSLGDDFKIERMKAASLRLGGVPISYDTHCLVVGDAAGMIDPMTGEGIHHAMEGGKLAAKFLDRVMNHGNYSREVMKIYHDEWMDKFGSDFKWSMMICQLIYRYPILLDAATSAVRHKGDKFLAKWADIMTGRVPKVYLLRPEFVIVIMYELLILLLKKLTGKYPRLETKEKSS